MGRLSRSAMAVAAVGAAGAIAAAVAAPARGATTNGTRYLQEYVSASYLSPGATGGTGQCSTVILSAAASDGSPAYVSGLVENTTSNPCTGWLQDSVNGGAWTDVSPRLTLPASGQGPVNYPWAKTANSYAGPGTSVRACVLTPATPQFPAEPVCSTSSVTLPASTATAPGDDDTSVFYAHNDQAANASSGNLSCFAALSSSDTLDKTAASRAGLLLNGTGNCTAWMETSADDGATWNQATPTYSLTLSAPRVEWGFPQAVADGTGELARGCVRLGTAAKACTAAW